MKWNEFLMVLAGIYLAYYGLNLVFDLINAKERDGRKDDDDKGVLHFSQDEPELIVPEEKPSDAAAPASMSFGLEDPEPAKPGVLGAMGIVSTGAVGLKELFALAKDDLIEYTRAISY